MGSNLYDVVWTKQAQQHLYQAYKYISQDSVKNAEKVVASITEAVYKAARNPEMYNPDKDKHDNDGSYRAFEKHRYRVSYRFKDNVLRVLRVRHTRMHPLSY
jgi:plasmid stabilization system protein ParE